MPIKTAQKLAKFRQECREYFAASKRKPTATKPDPRQFSDPVIRTLATSLMEEEERKATLN